MIMEELENPTKKRLEGVWALSSAWECFFYTSSAVIGYLSVLDKTTPLIINRPALPGSKDYLMLIGRVVVFLKNLTCLPLNVTPLRK